jgi:hypothetical protein
MGALLVKILEAQSGWPAYIFHKDLVGMTLEATVCNDGVGYMVRVPVGVGKKSEYYFMSSEVEIVNE